ncbi:MAG: hypothetical protein PHG49_01875 [Candidatus Pacebacteria bacterium]|nr:hypothetical protein [Candidatus Paceibacterota bacterium]
MQKHYVNGDLKYTTSITSGNIAHNCSSYTKIGSRGGGLSSASTPFNGYIDDVRIYERALSSEEVMKIYDNSKNKYE